MRAVRGRHVRVLLALGSAIFVAALVASLGRGTGTQRIAPIGSPDAPALGATAASAPSPAKMVGSARPHRVPSLLRLKPAPFKHQRAPEEFESYPARAPGSSTVDGAVQRSAAKHLMPSPIENFDGISNQCGCYPPDTEGDVGPNHYMEWVNLHYAIYSKTGTQIVPPTPGVK